MAIRLQACVTRELACHILLDMVSEIPNLPDLGSATSLESATKSDIEEPASLINSILPLSRRCQTRLEKLIESVTLFI